MKLLKFFKINIRPIIFTIILTFGFVVLIYIQTFNPPEYFIVGSLVLYLLMLLEFFSVRFWAKRKLEQLNMPMIDQYSHATHLVLHIFLPTLAYWAIAIFIFFDPNPGIWFPFIIFIFFLFLVLFINLRAYYEDKFQLEKSTHYVYDLLKLLIYAILVFNIYSLAFAYSINIFILFVLIFLTTCLMLSLNLVRYNHLNKSFYAYVVINSLIIGIIGTGLYSWSRFNIFEMCLMTFLLFYMSAGVLHHRIKRDLSKEIVAEYVIIALLALVMFSAV